MDALFLTLLYYHHLYYTNYITALHLLRLIVSAGHPFVYQYRKLCEQIEDGALSPVGDEWKEADCICIIILQNVHSLSVLCSLRR